MRSKHLIIFIDNVKKSNFKNRLTAGLGKKKAVEVYTKLLNHIYLCTRCLDCSKTVYSSDEIESKSIWSDGNFELDVQVGDTPAERMRNAFEVQLSKGAEKVCLLLPDTLEINQQIIEASFRSLQDHDIVIGPFVKGGFYLLGMKESQPELFHPKNWSTEAILTQTIADIQRLSLQYKLMPELPEILEKEDWLAHLKKSLS